MQDFREQLQRNVVLFDGAMGTEIYRRGVFINRAFEEINVSNPEMIEEIHAAYLRAGAQVLTTNTFGANPIRMKEFGLEEQFLAINQRGVAMARKVAQDRAWVAASIGPIGQALAPIGKLDPGQAFSAFQAQVQALLAGGPDLFILETFYDIAELWQAVRAVRSVSDLPVIACLAFSPDRGRAPADAPDLLATVAQWPVDGVGVNCGAGPRTLLEIVEATTPTIGKPLLAMPNAGHPQEVDGRQIYMASPEYMAEYARRFVLKGAKMVGGCCGTSPDMIKEMRSFIRSIAPNVHELPSPAEDDEPREKATPLEPTPVHERTEFARKLYSGKFCISVELDPPRGLHPGKSLDGAKFLLENGIDVINIADGPRAVARMGPSAMALLAREHCGIESVIHYCCRDRNLLGMQMDLIGANALGLRNVLAVTGDPPKMGTYPNATAVFDIDSIGLITFIQMMNRGLDFAGRPLGGKTDIFVGAGCNPASVDLDLEIERFGKKIDAGAEFFFSQPVYDEDVLFQFLERTERFRNVPFLVGILPLASYKNAEFLHNEVPGMQIPQRVRDRLRAAPDKEAQRRVGIEVARETLQAVYQHPRIHGAYIYPPFGSYPAVLDVVSVLADAGPRPVDIEIHARVS
jgi:methionine synthase I (cobalamin-dependent)/5,10-methylenetetrahydrofolate reductase